MSEITSAVNSEKNEANQTTEFGKEIRLLTRLSITLKLAGDGSG